MGKSIFLQSGQMTSNRAVGGTGLLVLDQLNTHQETGTLVFPLVTMQFFSSGLIMDGETVSEAIVLTIGRDLCV